MSESALLAARALDDPFVGSSAYEALSVSSEDMEECKPMENICPKDLLRAELKDTKIATKTDNAWVLTLPFSKDTLYMNLFNGETNENLTHVRSDSGVCVSLSAFELHSMIANYMDTTFDVVGARISIFCDQSGRYHARWLQYSVLPNRKAFYP